MKRVSEGAFWSLIYLSSLRIATLAISIAVGRLMGADGAGAFGIALQTVNLAALFATSYVPQSLVRALAANADPARRRGLLFASLGFVLAASALVGLAIVLGAGVIAHQGFRQDALVPVLVACAPAVLGTGLFLWAEGALQGLLEFRKLAVWGCALATLDLLVTIGLAGYGVPAILLSRAALRVAAALAAGVFWLRPSFARTPGHVAGTAAPELRGLLVFAGPALLSSLAALVGHYWVRVALTRAAGLDATGLYQAADNLAQGLTMVPAAVSSAYIPAVARTRDAGYPALGASLERALRMVSGINLPLCLGLVVLGPWLTVFLFGHEFTGSRAALAWLSMGYGTSALTVVFAAIQFARGETWGIFAAGTLWLVVVLLAVPFGIRLGGSGGAAAALAAAFVITLLSYPLFFARRWNVPLRPVAGPIAATIVLPLGLVLLVLHGSVGPLLIVGLGLAAALVVFLAWGRSALGELKGAFVRA